MTAVVGKIEVRVGSGYLTLNVFEFWPPTVTLTICVPIPAGSVHLMLVAVGVSVTGHVPDPKYTTTTLLDGKKSVPVIVITEPPAVDANAEIAVICTQKRKEYSSQYSKKNH